MLVGCCWLCVAWRLLCAVCNVLFVVRYLMFFCGSFAMLPSLCVARCGSFVVRCSGFVVCCALDVVCCTLSVVRRLLFVVCRGWWFVGCC